MIFLLCFDQKATWWQHARGESKGAVEAIPVWMETFSKNNNSYNQSHLQQIVLIMEAGGSQMEIVTKTDRANTVCPLLSNIMLEKL